MGFAHEPAGSRRSQHVDLIVEGDYEQVGTFNGNPLTMASAKAVLTEILDDDAYRHFDRLRERMVTGLEEAIAGGKEVPPTSAQPARPRPGRPDTAKRQSPYEGWSRSVNVDYGQATASAAPVQRRRLAIPSDRRSRRQIRNRFYVLHRV